MGQCSSDNVTRTSTTRAIDKQIKEDEKNQGKNPKLLLLGIGESGKSTIFKQFKIVQSNGGFNEEEKKAFISVVHYQCTSQIRTLIENAEKLGEEMGEKGKKAVAMMNDLYPSDQVVVNKELADLIEVIWNDEGIRKTYEARGKKFLLNDCADYFFNNIQRFAENNYIPNEADILRARTRSVGIESAQFRFQNMRIRWVPKQVKLKPLGSSTWAGRGPRGGSGSLASMM
eukprot:TRINITY_DN6280_c0_g1_i1.p1 TRINITY_DN6280_c0_g1~~TRINITY_DN6280_c0_g1_i1.p1  ORF type:complete len:229 (+),score=31.98 TRINITY_DN6280_c0_g1_i1:16-702(+)